MRLKSVAFLLLLLAAFGAGVYYLALPGPELSAPGLEAAAQEHPVAPTAHEAAPDPAGAGQEPGAEEARKVAPAPLEEPGRESHRVFGRVQDALGAPLAGVEVTLMPVFAHGPVRTWEPLARVQSAADGSWELRRPRVELPDRLTLLANKQGFVRGRADVAAAEGPETEVPAFVLREACVVEGQVKDEGGRPVAGARVFAPFGGWGGAGEVKSDEQGRYRLGGIAPGKTRLTVDAEGFALAFKDLEVAPAPVPLRADFQLGRGLSISGRVVSVTGLPVAGARVDLTRHSEQRAGVSLIVLGGGEGAETDGEGRFLISGLEKGHYEVRANAEGHLPARREKVEAGDQGVLLQLGLGGGIRGVALDPAGAALPEGRVACRPDSGGPDLEGMRFDRDALGLPGRARRGAAEWKAEDKGAFRVEGLAPGLWRVRIEAPGCAPREVEANVLAGVVTDLGAVKLDKGAWLEVTVRGTGDAPLAGAQVKALPEAGPDLPVVMGLPGGASRAVRANRAGQPPIPFGESGAPSGRTDAEGKVRLEGLAPGSWIVEAEHPEYAPGKAGPFALAAGQGAEAGLGLRPGGSLVVLVRDRQGRPKAEASVEIEGPYRRVERSDAQGLARFTRLPAGAYGVRLSRMMQVRMGNVAIGTNISGEDKEVPVAVAEGETARLELTAPGTWTLRGTVTGPNGPASGVRIACGSRSFFSGPQTLSGADGSWRLEDVPAGKLDLRWARKGAPVESTRVLELGEEGGEWEGNLELPTGVIEGRVLDAQGKPVADALVTIDEAAAGGVQVTRAIGVVMLGSNRRLPPMELPGLDAPEPVRTDAEGRFRVEQVPAGRWRVGTRQEDGSPGKGPVVVEVPAGGRAKAEPRL